MEEQTQIEAFEKNAMPLPTFDARNTPSPLPFQNHS